jgi:hypothetical protein
MKSRMMILASLVVLLMIACSLSGNTGGNSPSQEPTKEETPTSTPNPVPVSLNEGLASLNSYEMTAAFNSVGPDPVQSSTTSMERQRSNDTNASSTSIHSEVVGAEGGDPEISDTSIYQIGNDQCSGSDADEWTWTTSTPAEAEMQGLVTGMIGLTPLIDAPVFVAAETVNGIPANHFTFQVPGLGASSGAVVNINQGDYWLAIDGQYIVKYILIVETSMAADAKVLHEEISIDVDQINQPVNIAFPQSCLDASKVTPEP